MVYKRFMKLALEEAEKGFGCVNPNPMVGAVIIMNGEIIGKGHYREYGGEHAEMNALASCVHNPVGAAMYVTHEPCCHYGKTPPCTDAIIKSGIKEVVIGLKDPNRLISGKGIKSLKRNGIKVVSGVLEEACQKLNEVYFHYNTHKTPFLVMKYAMTTDGEIATEIGKSKGITGLSARAHENLERHKYSAIMVGVGSVIADDPILSCRVSGLRNPARIICDTNLSIPIESKIVKTARNTTTYVATSAFLESEKAKELRKSGVFLINVSQKDGHIDLQELMGILGHKNIDSVLLEGGATLNAAALKCGIVNKVNAYMAPKIFGVDKVKPAVDKTGIESHDEAYRNADKRVTYLGDGVLFEYTFRRRDTAVCGTH